MPLAHCKSCHHEWEGHDKECDWCGSGSYILAEDTPLERLTRVICNKPEGLKPTYEEVMDKYFWDIIHGNRNN